jgi:hypothetical protein
MRHVFLPVAISASSFGMRQPTAAAQLIASSRRPSCLPACPSRAIIAQAVDLAAVASAANDRWPTAARAPKDSCRDAIVLFGPTNTLVTSTAKSAILLRHSCPGTVWRTVPKSTCQGLFGTVLAAIVQPRSRLGKSLLIRPDQANAQNPGSRSSTSTAGAPLHGPTRYQSHG